ncbi:periplasmic heavy metal sensor [bacterium]|nr:periplasmic heavy metal sensor [bacterium]
MRRTMWALGGIAGAALVVAQAQARPPGPPPMGDGAMRAVMQMLHDGDLTDAQHDQVRAQMKTERASAEGTIDQLRAANDELTAALLASTAPDEATLRASLDKIAALRSALLDQQVQNALTIRGLLSADQLAAAAAAPAPDADCTKHPMP